MASMDDKGCWYCRKGGIVDLYLNGNSGVCPKCGKALNMNITVISIDAIIKAIPDVPYTVPESSSSSGDSSDDNKPLTMEQLKALPDGTKVYCYHIEDGKLVPDEWCVCRIKDRNMLKRTNGNGAHYFDYIATDCNLNRRNRRAYLKELDLDRQNKQDNKPLTNEELNQMNGQKVWLSSMHNGEEKFNNDYCGWYTIKAPFLKSDDGDRTYRLNSSNGTAYGFRAYRTDQSHRADD